MTERVFVAVPIPPEVRLAVDEWRNRLGLPGRPVPASNFHITLRFIGDVDGVGVDRVLAALDQAELGGPFVLRIGGLGAFPAKKKATVAWAAIEGGVQHVTELAGLVDEAVAAAGLGTEERPYRAHLTLARIRPPADIRDLEIAPFRARVDVDEIVLYRTLFDRGQVEYEVVDRFSLVPT